MDTGLPPEYENSGPARISSTKYHDRIVSDYLELVRFTRETPDQLVAQGGVNITAAHRFSARTHKMLGQRIGNARIFEIQPELYMKLDREIDHYLTEQVAGLTFKPQNFVETPWGVRAESPTITPEEQQHYSIACRRASANIGVPNPRPFDTMWLGLGRMISLSSRLHAVQAAIMGSAERHFTKMLVPPALIGVLISDDFVCEVNTCRTMVRGEERDSIMILPVWRDDMWLSADLGHPWLLNALIDIINQHDTLVMENPIIDKRSFKQRRWWQQTTKKAGIKGKLAVMPPMYYTVTIQQSTQQEKMKLALAGARNWTHRWDVRGHPLTKAQGGFKPIDPKVRRKLLQRGYTIIEDPEELTDEQASILTRHKKAFPTDIIWAATRTGWRKSFVKGPADRPYIPASWKLKEQKNE